MSVEWRPVPGVPGVEASSEGRIRRDGVPVRVLPHGGGYLRVRIGGAYHLLHRVVCLAFHGEPPAGRRVVAHYDGNPGNNAADNVRWATHAENSADRYRHGTAGRKLASADVEAIRGERARGRSTTAIGRRYGVSAQTVSQIANGVTWRPTPSPPAHPHDSGNPGPGGAFSSRG